MPKPVSSAPRGDWRHELLSMLGAKSTPQNLRFLSNWQRWEGGHTHNDARFNWLNTTMNAPGAVGEINDVGVKSFRSRRDGVNALASTILNGRYTDIVAGLKSGNPYKHNLSAGLSTWVSGSPTGNLGYVQKIMGSGAPKAAPPAPIRRAAGGRGPAGNPGLSSDPMAMYRIAFDDDPDFLELLGGFMKPSPAPVRPQRPQAPSSAPPRTRGGPGITVQLKDGGTHETSGLGWGTKSAEDIMGKPGTPVRLPYGGVVITWNPTGAQGGGSMLVRLANGRKVWLGHLARGLPAGTKFKPGQALGVISKDHPRPHVHADDGR